MLGRKLFEQIMLETISSLLKRKLNSRIPPKSQQHKYKLSHKWVHCSHASERGKKRILRAMRK